MIPPFSLSQSADQNNDDDIFYINEHEFDNEEGNSDDEELEGIMNEESIGAGAETLINDVSLRTQIFQQIMEDIMIEHGDLILRVFHKHNLTYSSSLAWPTLLQ